MVRLRLQIMHRDHPIALLPLDEDADGLHLACDLPEWVGEADALYALHAYELGELCHTGADGERFEIIPAAQPRVGPGWCDAREGVPLGMWR